MMHEENPFRVVGKIEPEYFCDRVKDSERLIKSVVNGNNIVVISPRRMGKTGLIYFCYEKPDIKSHYYTFFIDILHTSNLKEFTYLLGKEVYDILLPKSKKMLNLFVQTLKSINSKFGFDSVTGSPTFNIELGDIQRPEYTLEEIFSYLSMADMPCVVAIDEFQQIAKYPEKNIEALLRSHIQRIGNVNFIFAGSERHLMQNMFCSAARPFYRSADMLDVDPIPSDLYVPFVVEHLRKRGRVISEDTACWVYDLFKGHTYYIQKTFNEVFTNTPKGGECTIEFVGEMIENLLDENATVFRQILSNISEKQKEVLYAIARDGVAKQLTSSEFIKRHGLTSASSVQSAISKLLEKDLVTELDKSFSLTDRFLAMWINRIYAGGFAVSLLG